MFMALDLFIFFWKLEFFIYRQRPLATYNATLQFLVSADVSNKAVKCLK